MKSLYQRILGEQFFLLPKVLQNLHSDDKEGVYRGKCRVKRGKNLISNMLAKFLSLPKEGEDVEIIVNLKVDRQRELWHRCFNGQWFKSMQWQVGELLYEKLNCMTTLAFKVEASEEGLVFQLHQVYILGIPQIHFFCPKVLMRETEVSGKIHFFIQTSLPLFGLLVEYEGSLEK